MPRCSRLALALLLISQAVDQVRAQAEVPVAADPGPPAPAVAPADPTPAPPLAAETQPSDDEPVAAPPSPPPVPTPPAAAPIPEAYRLPPAPPGPEYPGPAFAADGRAGEPLLEEDPLQIPAPISTRLRVLTSDLNALAMRQQDGLGSGLMSMASGGLSIALAQLIDQEALQTFLYVLGCTSVLRGGLEVALRPDAQGAALQYSHYPMRVPEEVMDRLHTGERALLGLASDSKRLRMLDGAVSIAGGAIAIPLLLLNRSSDGKDGIDTLDVFVAIGAGVSILSGIVSMVSSSEAEKRNDSYEELREKLRRPPQTRPSGPEISLSGAPGQAGLRMRGRW